MKKQHNEEKEAAEKIARKLTGQPIPALLVKSGYSKALLITNREDAAAFVAIVMRAQFCTIDGYGSTEMVKVGGKAESWDIAFIDERKVSIVEEQP